MTSTHPPAGLAERGRGFWTEVTDTYELEPADRIVLAELCRVLDELDAMHAVLDAEGPTATGSSGQTVEHPLSAALRAHRATLDKLVVRLGLPDERGARPLTELQRRSQTAHAARWGSLREAAAREAGTAS